MKTIITNLTIISIALLLNPQYTNAQCHIDDWTALKALYESTNGPNWRIIIWKSCTVCFWMCKGELLFYRL